MVSVCMATYNGAKYIKEQVDSIMSQINSNDEIIISDDGSTDDTISILCSYNDPRIKIFPNECSRGVVGNFENALSKASGDYIFLSDQDDIWCDNKVQKCLKVLNHCDLVLHNAKILRADKIEANSFFSINNSKKGYFRNLCKNSYIGCCMAFNRNLLARIMPFPQNIIVHDMYIGLIAERNFTVEHIEDILMHYRRHGNNASPTSEKSENSFMFKIKYRIDMLLNTF